MESKVGLQHMNKNFNVSSVGNNFSFAKCSSNGLGEARTMRRPSEQSMQADSISSSQGAKSEKALDLTNIPPLVSYASLDMGEFIGSGGFGKVNKAQMSGKSVAVKQVQPQRDETPDETKLNVLREGKLFWKLEHRNIVKLLALCLEEDHLCLIMEYASGGSVARVLKRRRIGLPPDVLISWAEQISEGMYYLHSQNILHRDLKSSNILIQESPKTPTDMEDKLLKITDFGLAKENVSHTTRMSPAGTYAWMSPEVIKQQTYSMGSDVWSFGVVLWEMLTGEEPYRGVDPMAVAYGVAVNRLTLPIPSTCPVEIKNIMEDCWKPDHRERPGFGSITDDLEDLRDISFMHTPQESFNSMQADWKDEIQRMFEEVKEMELELQNKEVDVNMKQQELTELERHLKQKEEQLAARERVVFQKELEMLIKSTSKEPVAAKKSWKAWKPSKKLPQIISPPEGLKRIISVVDTAQRSPETPPGSPGPTNQSRLVAIVHPPEGTKNRTWGPATSRRRLRDISEPPMGSSSRQGGREVRHAASKELRMGWMNSLEMPESMDRRSRSRNASATESEDGMVTVKAMPMPMLPPSPLPLSSSGQGVATPTTQTRKFRQRSPLQVLLCQMAAPLAAVGLGQDVSCAAAEGSLRRISQSDLFEAGRDAYRAAVRDNMLSNESEISRQQSRHHTYHGQGIRQRQSIFNNVPLTFREVSPKKQADVCTPGFCLSPETPNARLDSHELVTPGPETPSISKLLDNERTANQSDSSPCYDAYDTPSSTPNLAQRFSHSNAADLSSPSPILANKSFNTHKRTPSGASVSSYGDPELCRLDPPPRHRTVNESAERPCQLELNQRPRPRPGVVQQTSQMVNSASVSSPGKHWISTTPPSDYTPEDSAYIQARTHLSPGNTPSGTQASLLDINDEKQDPTKPLITNKESSSPSVKELENLLLFDSPSKPK